ncbi:MAG: HNH endonuclease [Candidatus Methylumidiphilus sp.]
MRLIIRYRTSSNKVTERLISDLEIAPPSTVYAYCHLRNECREFRIERIEHAVDADTGEIIPDVWLYLGLPSLKPKLQMPVFTLVATPMSTSESMNLRKADKDALFKPFRLPCIINVKKRELFTLFGNCCFHCGSDVKLQIDHHIPQFLGGRMVPGNIVILCASCNELKSKANPSDFYTSAQLEKLKSILLAQLEIYNFTFNWTIWNHEPKEYLLSLGVSEQDAIRCAKDPGYDPERPWKSDD